MAALAYLLLPITGLLAFSLGSQARTRFHGLQAIAIGVIWPIALYLASAFSAAATRVVFIVGALVWLALLVSTALGRDLRLPVLGSAFDETAAEGRRN